MNTGQWLYMIALAGLFLWRGPTFCAWVLLGNAVVTLAACGAMDMGALDRHGATLTIMLIDFVAGAVLVSQPGLPRLLAIGYAVTVPLYATSVIFSVSEATLFAVVIGIGFVQIAVAGIGSGDHGGGGLRRRADVHHFVAVPRGTEGQGALHLGEALRVVEGVNRGP